MSGAIELFVPGRLCLFGEHSDWAGGYRRDDPTVEPGLCLAVGTEQGIHARAGTGDPGRLRLRSVLPDGRVLTLDEPMTSARLAAIAADGGWWSYAAGTACELRERFDVGGLALDAGPMTLPLRKGLSSSAALCVLVARAFDRVWGLGLTTRDEMELAYLGERRTPSRCGRLDQVCAFGPVPCALRFDGDRLDVRPLEVGGPLHLLIVDLAGCKDTVRILASLDAAFVDGGSARCRALRRALGTANRSTGEAAIEALTAGDAAALGALMTRAQARFDRDVAPICPSELTAPRLHAALSLASSSGLSLGGKGVGSQGDGAAQLVTGDEATRDRLAARLAEELGMVGLPLTLRPRD